MYALTTMLSDSVNDLTKQLWKTLQCDCELLGIQIVPSPHFSWLGCEEINMPEFKNALRNISLKMREFSVSTTGLGLFTGNEPVVFIPIVKTRTLIDAHELIWNTLIPFCVNPNNYYAPDHWVPHITLAMHDINPKSAGCAIEKLLPIDFNFTINVNHLELAYAIDNQLGSIERVNLKTK